MALCATMNYYDDLEVEIPPESEIALEKRKVFYYFYGTIFVSGFLSSTPDSAVLLQDVSSVLFYAAYVFTAFYWCTVDKRQRGRVLNPFWGAWFMLFLPVALPFYLIANKGIKTGTILVVKSLLLIPASFIAFILASIISSKIFGT